MDPELVADFRDAVETRAGSSTSGILGSILGAIPQNGRYAGNGDHDAWVIWQAYNDVFGDGTTIERTREGADKIQELISEYEAENPDDPLGIMPLDQNDWNAFFHDIGSIGGLITGVVNHLVFSVQQVWDFLHGGDLYDLISAPFMALFGNAMEVVTFVTDLAFEVFEGAWDAMGSLWEGMSDAFDSMMSFDFLGAMNDLASGFTEALRDIGRAIGDLVDALFPVVLDMDGDGVELIALEDSRASLGADEDGSLWTTGWVAADDAILAFDDNGNGGVDGSSEYAFVERLEGARTDLEGLAAFDTNEDGVLDAGDAQFGSFLIWQDANGDGVCEAGEARSLTEAGITSIDLGLNGDEFVLAGANVFNTGAFTFADGSEGMLADVAFKTGLTTSRSVDFGWGVLTGGAAGIYVQAGNAPIDLSEFFALAARRFASGDQDWMIA